MCEEVRTEPITLSEMGNMPLPRQHASKHLLLLGRETRITITTVHTFRMAILYFVLTSLYHTHTTDSQTQPHHRFTNTSYTHARRFVCVFSTFRAGGLESFFQEAWCIAVLTPNNVTIVAPGATNLGVSPSVSRDASRSAERVDEWSFVCGPRV